MAHVIETGNAPLLARPVEASGDAPAQHTPIARHREAEEGLAGAQIDTHWSRVLHVDLMNREEPAMPLTVLRPRVAEQSRVQGLGSLPKLVPTVLVVAVQFALALLISVAVHALPTIPEAAVLPDEQPHEAAGAAAVD